MKNNSIKQRYKLTAGQVFGRLTSIGKTQIKKYNGYLWEFSCSCGNAVNLSVSAVRGGQKSCGCLGKETRPNLSHGHCGNSSQTKTYTVWRHMKERCNNTKLKHYSDYGGRGIKVCDEWNLSFEAFLSDMGTAPEGLSLDRIDNDKGYSKENCRWVSQRDQLRNTRRTIRVVLDGKEYCLKDACNHLGVSYDCVRSRIRKGASPYDALHKVK